MKVDMVKSSRVLHNFGFEGSRMLEINFASNGL